MKAEACLLAVSGKTKHVGNDCFSKVLVDKSGTGQFGSETCKIKSITITSDVQSLSLNIHKCRNLVRGALTVSKDFIKASLVMIKSFGI